MRTFIVLALIVAVARADVGGYNYGSSTGGGFKEGFGNTGSQYGGNGGGIGGGSNYHGSAPAEYQKEFFTYSAPEGEFDAGKNLDDAANSLKQNLRVIFIKGPENNGLENAALQLAKSSGDSKTAVYVLTKQGDISDLANKLQSLNNRNANKPEVHFVKYRTPEDAANAQRQIQQQYDNLGGTSQSHNGGVAPVLNFASAAPRSNGGGYGGNVANTYVPPSPAQTYIPPAEVKAPASSYLPIFKH